MKGGNLRKDLKNTSGHQQNSMSPGLMSLVF